MEEPQKVAASQRNEKVARKTKQRQGRKPCSEKVAFTIDRRKAKEQSIQRRRPNQIGACRPGNETLVRCVGRRETKLAASAQLKPSRGHRSSTSSLLHFRRLSAKVAVDEPVGKNACHGLRKANTTTAINAWRPHQIAMFWN